MTTNGAAVKSPIKKVLTERDEYNVELLGKLLFESHEEWGISKHEITSLN